MGKTLAAIGRARPSRSVLDFIQGKNAIEQNERRNQLTAADLAMSSEQLSQLKRQGEYQEKRRQEGETPLAVETLASQFEGGPDGPMFKMVYDMADSAGFVDKSVGGLGTVKKRQLPEIYQMMSDPNFTMKLSRTRIDYWRGQMTQIQTSLKEKPTDQKLLQAFQQASAGLNQAIGHDSDLTQFRKQEAEAKKAEAALLKAERETGTSMEEKLRLHEEKKKIDQKFKDTKSTKSERADLDLAKAAPELDARAAEDPMAVYRDGIKMNDDGTVWKDPIKKLPKVLPEFTEALGKRGGPTALRAAGEYYQDATEITDMLNDPQVAEDLKTANEDGVWDRTRGSLANRIDAWMTKSGIAEDSPTATVLRRMQMMASSARKEFLGSAVTGTELKTITGWLLDPGDSYSAMVNKINLIRTEGRQELKDFMDLYRNVANMSDWYDQYGISRFEQEQAVSDMSDEELMESLKGIAGGN